MNIGGDTEDSEVRLLEDVEKRVKTLTIFWACNPFLQVHRLFIEGVEFMCLPVVSDHSG